jgi:small-conductance mechanosensitive channel
MDQIPELFQTFIKLPFIQNQGRTLALMALLFFTGRYAIGFIARRIRKMADDGNDDIMTGREKRAATIAGMFKTAGNIALSIVLFGLTLSLFGVNAATLLGAAGLLTFAVGFGAQALIKDFVAGMFIFAENQFAVGDKVKINDKEGVVRRMSIRATILESDAKTDEKTGVTTPGCLIFIANGGITSVCNYSLIKAPEKPAEATAEPLPTYRFPAELEAQLAETAAPASPRQ